MKNNIPIIKVQSPSNIGTIVQKQFDTGYIGYGKTVVEFENNLSNILRSEYVSYIMTGTAALHLSYILAGIKSGDEVLSSPLTCSATNIPALYLGAKLRWYDVLDNGCYDVESIKKRITKKTKVIILVYWGGYCEHLYELQEIQKEYNVKIIVDAAHALGTLYDDVNISNYFDYVMYSLQATKIIHTIEGGLLVVRDKLDKYRSTLLKWYGIDRESEAYNNKKYEIEYLGYKYNPNDVHASIGLEQLNYLEDRISRNREITTYYNNNLKNSSKVQVVKYDSKCKSNCWLYTLNVDDVNRFYNYMKGHNIEVSPIHNRNDKYDLFSDFREDTLYGMDYYEKHGICIPSGNWLSDEEMLYIVDTVNNYK